MDIKVPILAALIGALGGLVGGSVTAVTRHFMGLEANRQDLLREERRNAYVDWLEVRTLSRQIDDLIADNKIEQSEKKRDEFDLKGRSVMGKIATYGGAEVVRSVAHWYRTDSQITTCKDAGSEDLKSEIAAHQAMRRDLMPNEAAVSDEDMTLLLLQCRLSSPG